MSEKIINKVASSQLITLELKSFKSKEEIIAFDIKNWLFKEQILKLPSGKILLPAEGEGRNAVFAAQNNWLVEAFDSSKEAKKKAFSLLEISSILDSMKLYRSGLCFPYLMLAPMIILWN